MSSLGKNGRHHLVQQRLKQVMVGAVGDCYLNRCPAESLRGEQAGEPAADDRGLMRRSGTESDAARISAHAALGNTERVHSVPPWLATPVEAGSRSSSQQPRAIAS